jgi:hypothetical protein
MAGTDEALTAWHDRLFLLLTFLADLDLQGTGITLDHSRASLTALEQVVLDRFVSVPQVAWPTRRTFVEGLAAYLGETLMRRAGGAWAWATTPAVDGFPDGVPLASADPALGLDPVSPVHLLQQAVRGRDGAQFTQVYDRWTQAVDDRTRTDPTWRPHKEPTAADRPDPESAPLRQWLSRQAAAFPAWVTAHAPDHPWDFQPASLADLATLVRRVTPTAQMLNAPANRDFREGAAWYLGETVRRCLGGRWNLNLRRSGERNFPYLEQIGPRRARLTPVVALEAELTEPGYLRRRWELASGHPWEG